jgi:hypothetical protein
MLEGTDAKIHFVQYTPEMERLRADGCLRPNAFLRLRWLVTEGRTVLSVQDLGDSEKVLKNRALLGENARALLKRGIMPTEGGWGGWLGRYQTSLVDAAGEIQNRERKKDLSRGR